MKQQLFPAAALAAVLIMAQRSATAQKPVSNITDLGTLGDYSDAFGINNISSDRASVQVVGRSVTPAGYLRAFVWTAPAPMIDLGTLGGTRSLALEINNHGQVVGQSDDASRQRWAVVWNEHGR